MEEIRVKANSSNFPRHKKEADNVHLDIGQTASTLLPADFLCIDRSSLHRLQFILDVTCNVPLGLLIVKIEKTGVLI